VDLISVIMPVYNREAYVADALRSIQEQEVDADIEVVVVDDGSSDRSREIVAEMAADDPRIRLIEMGHRGVAAARNAGFEALRGNFVAFLDSDDLFTEGRLARHLAVLRAEPQLGAVGGAITFFRRLAPDGQPVPISTIEQNILGLPGYLFRRGVFDQVGVCDETFAQAEDGDLILRMREAGILIAHDPENCLWYRRHDDNITNDENGLDTARLKMVHASLIRRRLTGEVRPIPAFYEGTKKLSE